MVIQGPETQRKTLSWPLAIHPSWYPGRCRFTMALWRRWWRWDLLLDGCSRTISSISTCFCRMDFPRPHLSVLNSELLVQKGPSMLSSNSDIVPPMLGKRL
jgi:hypothetical protein